MTKEEALKVFRSYKIWDLMDNFATDELQEMIDAIVSTPSIPSNLDEAAEDSWAVYEYRESPRGLYSTCYVDGFKAGAEWMAGQGETHEHYVIREVAGHDIGPAIVCYPETFEIGDKVIVQIRKIL